MQFKKKNKYTLFLEDDMPSIQEMNEMLNIEEKEKILSIISGYESKQTKKFIEQLNIIYDACYLLDAVILPSIDDEVLKSLYAKHKEEFTQIFNTFDEIRKTI